MPILNYVIKKAKIGQFLIMDQKLKDRSIFDYVFKILRSVNLIMDQKVQYLIFQNYKFKIIDVNFYRTP